MKKLDKHTYNEFESEIRRICLEQDFTYQSATPQGAYTDTRGNFLTTPTVKRFRCVSRTRPFVEIHVQIHQGLIGHGQHYLIELHDRRNPGLGVKTYQEQLDYERRRDRFWYALRDALDELEHRIEAAQAKNATDKNAKSNRGNIGRKQDAVNAWAIEQIRAGRDKTEVEKEYWQRRRERGDAVDLIPDMRDTWKKNVLNKVAEQKRKN